MDAYKPRPAQQQQQQQQTQAIHDDAKIFVGGLSWQTKEESLRYHFEQYGQVTAVEVMRDRVTGDPRGFAFVIFAEDATVELVMANLPHEINHKTVDVKRAQARGTAPPSIHGSTTNGAAGGGGPGGAGGAQEFKKKKTHQAGGGGGGSKELTPEQLQNKVFVGGLPLHLDKDGLRDFFQQFGTVVDAIVMMDATQSRSRGFGFVTFENGSGGAQKSLGSQPIYIDNKYVEIKLAMPKGDPQQFNSGGGLRNPSAASNATQSSGEFAGLAASFGRSGWKAGYGTVAFGKTGWNVQGWEEGSFSPDQVGFSFDLLEKAKLLKKSGRDRDRSSGSGRSKKSRARSDSSSSREVKRSRY
jgi:RNA-binding protein Musashi